MVILISVPLLTGSGNISSENNFSCAGKNDNGMVIFREFPVLHFSGQKLKITGSDIFSTYNFKICDVSNTLISFATDQEQCHAGIGAINTLKAAYGKLNIGSGQLAIAGSQGLHGEYQCKEIIKK
jgi:hypothetical protein